MVILGIDPGTRQIGYGAIKYDASTPTFLAAGVFKTKSRNAPQLLLEAKQELLRLMSMVSPELIAFEKLFLVHNQKAGLSVAEVRGALILTALEAGLRIREYAPNEVKLGIAGYGFADKKTVAKMVALNLYVPASRLNNHATDALAIALFAHAHETNRVYNSA